MSDCSICKSHVRALYNAAELADMAWHNALAARYGRDAGNARYDRRANGELNKSDAELHRLHALFGIARDAWWLQTETSKKGAAQ